MSYFAIERNGQYVDNVAIINENDSSIGFDEYLHMTYDEMKFREDLDDFVLANMEAADTKFAGEDDQTIVTLIGDDDVFIWSIIMGSENDEIRYVLVDWKKDGHQYRYEG